MGFGAVFVPGFFDEAIDTAGVVIGFHVVGCEVAGLAKVGGVTRNAVGQGEGRSHLMGAGAGRPDAGDEGGT